MFLVRLLFASTVSSANVSVPVACPDKLSMASVQLKLYLFAEPRCIRRGESEGLRTSGRRKSLQCGAHCAKINFPRESVPSVTKHVFKPVLTNTAQHRLDTTLCRAPSNMPTRLFLLVVVMAIGYTAAFVSYHQHFRLFANRSVKAAQDGAWNGEVVSNTKDGRIQGCTIQNVGDSVIDWIIQIDG